MLTVARVYNLFCTCSSATQLCRGLVISKNHWAKASSFHSKQKKKGPWGDHVKIFVSGKIWFNRIWILMPIFCVCMWYLSPLFTQESLLVHSRDHVKNGNTRASYVLWLYSTGVVKMHLYKCIFSYCNFSLWENASWTRWRPAQQSFYQLCRNFLLDWTKPSTQRYLR